MRLSSAVISFLPHLADLLGSDGSPFVECFLFWDIFVMMALVFACFYLSFSLFSNRGREEWRPAVGFQRGNCLAYSLFLFSNIFFSLVSRFGGLLRGDQSNEFSSNRFGSNFAVLVIFRYPRPYSDLSISNPWMGWISVDAEDKWGCITRHDVKGSCAADHALPLFP
jgi:hypothetical protein